MQCSCFACPIKTNKKYLKELRFTASVSIAEPSGVNALKQDSSVAGWKGGEQSHIKLSSPRLMSDRRVRGADRVLSRGVGSPSRGRRGMGSGLRGVGRFGSAQVAAVLVYRPLLGGGEFHNQHGATYSPTKLRAVATFILHFKHKRITVF